MSLTDEVHWSLFDFSIATLFLSSLSLTIEITLTKVKPAFHRLIALTIISAIYFILWIEISVGAFGSPVAGN